MDSGIVLEYGMVFFLIVFLRYAIMFFKLLVFFKLKYAFPQIYSLHKRLYLIYYSIER